MFMKLTLAAGVLFGAAVVSVPAQNNSKRIGSTSPQAAPTPSRAPTPSPLLQTGGFKQPGQGTASKPAPSPSSPKLPPFNTNKPAPPKSTTNPNPLGTTGPKTTTPNPLGTILGLPKNQTPGSSIPQTTTTGRFPLPSADKLKLPVDDRLKLGDLKTANKSSINPNVRRTPIKPTPNNSANLQLKNGSFLNFVKNGGQLRGAHGQFHLPFEVAAKNNNKLKTPSSTTRGFAKAQTKQIENKYHDKLTPAQKSALHNFQQYGTWSPQDRAVISNMMFSNSIGMTNQETAALSRALMLDRMLQNDDDEPAVGQGQISTTPSQIRVVNRTGEKLKLWVQYRTAAVPPSSEWNPMYQNQLSALEYSLEPGDDEEGRSFDLRAGGKFLTAYSIHYWAMTPTEQWADYMEQELVLTPDEDNIYELAFVR